MERKEGSLLQARSWIFSILLVLLVWTIPDLPSARAHGILDKTTHHHLILKADKNYLDLQIDLTFPPAPAANQRQLLDRDNNGRITSKETSHYLAGTSLRVPQELVVKIDGKDYRLFELYPPEIDLLDNSMTGSYPLILRFFYSIRTPQDIRADSVIEVEDRLWQEEAALCSLRIRSQKAHNLERRSTLSEAGSSRTFRLLWETLMSKGDQGEAR